MERELKMQFAAGQATMLRDLSPGWQAKKRRL